MKQVTIIGAGVIGLSTALYCARRGMKVTLIERNLPQRDGCSFGNAGMIVPSHFIPLAAPGIVSSLLLTFIVSFDEFLLSFFLTNQQPTLPVYIWSQLRFPNKLPGVLAMGAVILVVSCILVVIAEWVRQLGTSERKVGVA